VTSVVICESCLNYNEKFIFAFCFVYDVPRSELFVHRSDHASPAMNCFFCSSLTRSRGLTAQACHSFSFLLSFSVAGLDFLSRCVPSQSPTR
jgi:hypothetical protein